MFNIVAIDSTVGKGDVFLNCVKQMDWFCDGIIFAGECIGRFTNRKIPYCVKFNPDEVIFCNPLSFLLF